MKKALCSFLALLMIFAVVAGCASNNSGSKETSKESSAVTAGRDTTDTEKNFDPGLPENFDADGFNFVILNSNQAEIAGILNDIAVDMDSVIEGDVLSEAMYRRDTAIKDTYNCEITQTEVSSPDIQMKVYDSYNAGTDDYSLVNVIGNLVYAMANNGYLYNLNYLDHVDLTKEWWTPGSIEGYSLKNQIYYAASDLTICDDEGTAIIMYNETVASDYKLKTPNQMYDLVKDGDWTWDKMFNMAKTVGTGGDNGDDVLGDGDKFGVIVCDWSYIGMMIAGGQRFSIKDEEDVLIVNFGSKSFVDVLDTLVQHTKSKRTYVCPTYDCSLTQDPFRNNDALMIMQVTAHIRNSRDMEGNFAVLPMPKYTESQDYYYSYCPRVTYLGVPSTIEDADMVGGILEALTAKSSEIVMPAYYEKALSAKFMRDEGSKDMVEYIFGHTVYDPLVSTLCWDTVFGVFTSMVKSRSNMVTVAEKKYGDYIRNMIDTSVECYTELAAKYE